jgi:hypothetical protein
MSDINFSIILHSIYNYLPPWGGIRLEKLRVFRLAKKPQAINGIQKVHYRVHNSPLLILDKFNPVQAVPHFCFKCNLILSLHPGSSSNLSLYFTFHHQTPACIFTMRATCPSHLIVLSHQSNNHA